MKHGLWFCFIFNTVCCILHITYDILHIAYSTLHMFCIQNFCNTGMCFHVYTYICIRMYLYVYTHIYICIYTCIFFAPAYTDICIRIYMYIILVCIPIHYMTYHKVFIQLCIVYKLHYMLYTWSIPYVILLGLGLQESPWTCYGLLSSELAGTIEMISGLLGSFGTIFKNCVADRSRRERQRRDSDVRVWSLGKG